jgi:hypothetical protein
MESAKGEKTLKAVPLAATLVALSFIFVGCPINFGHVIGRIQPDGAIEAGAQWRIDGGEWQNTEVTLYNIATGEHIVSFKAIDGWITPEDQIIEILENQIVVAEGVYDESITMGSLIVTVSPADAVTAGARWRLDGGNWHGNNYLMEDIEPGTHTISFKDAEGWITPANEGVDIVAGQTSAASAIYTPEKQEGSLIVGIEPQAAVASGARWQLDNGPWQYDGTKLTGISVGNHKVYFDTITGWIAPAGIVVSITAGHVSTAMGTYVNSANGAITVTLLPAEAVTAGAMWRVDSGSFQASGKTVSDLTAGLHVISYKETVGYVKPANVTLEIAAGATTALTASYTSSTPTDTTKARNR